MAIGHFSIGALAAFLLASLVARGVVRSPTVVVGGGAWALVPDVHWVVPVGERALYSFHSSVWAEVFFLHRTIDRLDPWNSRPVAGLSICLLLLVVVVVEVIDRRGQVFLERS